MNIPTICAYQHDEPLLLDVRKLPPLDRVEKAVDIAGTRNASEYLELTERLASDLVAQGVAIMSGLALGVDSAAHRGALAGDGRTVAEGRGAVISEYPPGKGDSPAETKSSVAPRRGRKSGPLITADFALTRTVFAVRWRVGDSRSGGTLGLKQGPGWSSRLEPSRTAAPKPKPAPQALVTLVEKLETPF